MSTCNAENKISLKKKRWDILKGMGGGVMVLFGLLGFLWILDSSQEMSQFERNGQQVTAKITERVEENADPTRYYISYQFDVLSHGETTRTVLKNREQIAEWKSDQLYKDVSIGDEIEIIYPREMPGDSRIKGNYDMVVLGMPVISLNNVLAAFALFAFGGILFCENLLALWEIAKTNRS